MASWTQDELKRIDASFLDKYADSQYSVTMSTEPVRRHTLEVVSAD